MSKRLEEAIDAACEQMSQSMAWCPFCTRPVHLVPVRKDASTHFEIRHRQTPPEWCPYHDERNTLTFSHPYQAMLCWNARGQDAGAKRRI